MSKHKNRVNIVYSTNPDFHYEHSEASEADTLPERQQKLIISLDKKSRAGKQVTLISGFIGKQADLELLCKQLKGLCGSGGSAKDSQILIQGDQREKVFKYLSDKGYKTAKSG